MKFEDGKLIFSREYLRSIKQNRICPESVTIHRGKCPSCGATVEFTEARTIELDLPIGIVVPICDDEGISLGRCTRCHDRFSVRVLNPDISFFRMGAENEGHAFDPIDAALSSLPCMTDHVNVENQVGRREYTYDFTSNPLYICDTCGCGLDSIAFKKLSEQHAKISKAYGNYVNWSLGNGYGGMPEYTIVRISFKCDCENMLTAFFYTGYREQAFPENKDISLANIIGSRRLSSRIPPALYSKNEVIDWLYKLLSRWMLTFDEVYVISPFIGHQFLKAPVQLTSWLDLIKRLDHRKTRIITRSGQLRRFRNAFSEMQGRTYDELVMLDLGSPTINQTKQGSNSHAKVYCAVGKSHCEVFSGSGNVVRGPSKEVMHFHQVDSEEDFRNAFLNPLGVQPLVRTEEKRRFSIVLDERYGFDPLRIGGEVTIQNYWELVMNDLGACTAGKSAVEVD